MQLVAKSDQSTGNSTFASYVIKSNDLVPASLQTIWPLREVFQADIQYKIYLTLGCDMSLLCRTNLLQTIGAIVQSESTKRCALIIVLFRSSPSLLHTPQKPQNQAFHLHCHTTVPRLVSTSKSSMGWVFVLWVRHTKMQYKKRASDDKLASCISNLRR